jgi:hypothetical protein
LYREIEVAQKVREDRWNDQIILAWRIEAIHLQTQHMKRLPDLRTLLIGQAPRRQTVEQQRAVLHQLADHYGLPIATTKKEMH